MKGYKHNTSRKPAGRISLFPTPYPDESFYSVLCRYHIRSGNVSDWYTSNQLFGYNSSLTSTLLTPFHLEMAKHWGIEGSGLDPQKMLHQNTAYNLYTINTIPSELERIQDVMKGYKTTEAFPRWMHPRLINPSGFLRYCPECAAEQIKLYGESYWQVFPQIDEVEYCPRHKIRIRNSPVPLKSIRFHYHPASLFLTTEELRYARNTRTQEWDALFKKDKRFFIKLSCNIDWLLKNGETYAGYENLSRSYNKLSSPVRERSWFEISKQKLREILFGISCNNDLYLYLKHKNPKQVGSDSFYLYSLRLCSHVLVMTALCGTPKAFYDL